MLDDGQERLASNEATFREINESIQAGRQTLDGVVGFVCECGALGCNEVIELTLAQYEAVRADPRHFVVVPGHETDDVEDPVGGDEGHTVVAKRGRAAELAESSDPRAPSGAAEAG